jgi:hypothetical protein
METFEVLLTIVKVFSLILLKLAVRTNKNLQSIGIKKCYWFNRFTHNERGIKGEP